jgi:hypothetical protein
MRAGEMSNKPETLEHRQSLQKDRGGNWENLVDENEKGAGGRKEAKPKQRTDGRDDFFEEDGTGSESPERWEPATHTQPAEVPSKRRADKSATNHASQHSKPPDRHLTEVKTTHQKNRESTTATDWQGICLGD